jgi:hypothetical protein
VRLRTSGWGPRAKGAGDARPRASGRDPRAKGAGDARPRASGRGPREFPVDCDHVCECLKVR